MLKDKNILIGVCGSIASYKSAELTRLFVKAGANVKIIMTEAASSFITPLTLSTLSKNQVLSTYYNAENGNWHNHVELALWADIFIIAPATANTISKLANGICDNLLTAAYLSAKCPVYFAPAMDLDMWKHPAVKNNVQTLIDFGNINIPPGKGELASGLHGEGRMAEPKDIYELVSNHFLAGELLKGKKVLITAGPTHEAIDPVRFIGNHSSGKMGFAIADVCARQGADVTLICGPNCLSTLHRIERIEVVSAQDMYDAVVERFEQTDICILSAAVADYTPAEPAEKKIKKEASSFELKLKKTKDIAAELGKLKKHQLLVGFALETDNEETNAWAKLERKNLDFIVLNSLQDKGAGFKSDLNKITILKKNRQKLTFELKPKIQVAKDIVNELTQLI